MDQYQITITPSTPPASEVQCVVHDTMASHGQTITHANHTYADTLTGRHSNEHMTGWYFNDDRHLGPSFGIVLTSGQMHPYRENFLGQEERAEFEGQYFDLDEFNYTNLNPFPPQSPDSFSMLPIFRTLGELSGGNYPPVSAGDSPPLQLLLEVNEGLLPSIPTPSSPPLSPLIFASSSDALESPENHMSLLFKDDDVLSELAIPSDRTIEVGSSFDKDEYSLYRTASGSSSEGASGSPFSLQLLYTSSPNTTYSSSLSLTGVPADSLAQVDEDNAASHGERVTPAHRSSSNCSVDAFSYPSHLHQARNHQTLADGCETLGWLLTSAHGQWLEPSSPMLSSSYSDIGTESIDDGNATSSGKPIASKASREASDKRRKKYPKYPCPICPQRLTSRDNLLSHLDAHNNIKRYSCEYCPDRLFRTRAVLVRHQKSSRCGKTSHSMALHKKS